jgi:hypothetical protein
VPVGDRRADELVRERRPEPARPGHRLFAEQPDEQVELFLVEVFVVGEVETEERERLDRRTAADDQLGAAVRDGVERGELGVEPNGVLGAEHGDGRAEADSLCSAGDRGEDHVAGGVHELGAVVLADVEGVDPDRLGEDRLLDRVPDRLITADWQTGVVDRHRHERVEAELECRGHLACSLLELL